MGDEANARSSLAGDDLPSLKGRKNIPASAEISGNVRKAVQAKRVQALLRKLSTVRATEGLGPQQRLQQTKRESRFNSFFRKYDQESVSHYVPCLHLPYQDGASKVLVYFHANAEDIVLSHELLENIKRFLKVHVISVEYPGYGLYQARYQKRTGRRPAPTKMSVKQNAMFISKRFGKGKQLSGAAVAAAGPPGKGPKSRRVDLGEDPCKPRDTSGPLPVAGTLDSDWADQQSHNLDDSSSNRHINLAHSSHNIGPDDASDDQVEDNRTKRAVCGS